MRDIIELLKGELIGKKAAAINKKRANIIVKGRIVDETKNTFTFETEKGKKRVIKQNIIIEIRHKNKKIRIDGKKLAVAPEERIKIKVK